MDLISFNYPDPLGTLVVSHDRLPWLISNALCPTAINGLGIAHDLVIDVHLEIDAAVVKVRA